MRGMTMSFAYEFIVDASAARVERGEARKALDLTFIVERSVRVGVLDATCDLF